VVSLPPQPIARRNLSVRYVGQVRSVGLSAGQVERVIEAGRLKDKAIEPQVS